MDGTRSCVSGQTSLIYLPGSLVPRVGLLAWERQARNCPLVVGPDGRHSVERHWGLPARLQRGLCVGSVGWGVSKNYASPSVALAPPTTDYTKSPTHQPRRYVIRICFVYRAMELVLDLSLDIFHRSAGWPKLNDQPQTQIR